MLEMDEAWFGWSSVKGLPRLLEMGRDEFGTGVRKGLRVL